MHTHVKVLAILNIISGAIGVCAALFMGAIFALGAGAVLMDGDPDAAVAIPMIGLTGGALVLFLMCVSLPAVIIGAGLLKLRPWARIAGIVWAALSLTVFPIGTALGIYGLWVLFQKETERLFAGQPLPVP